MWDGMSGGCGRGGGKEDQGVAAVVTCSHIHTHAHVHTHAHIGACGHSFGMMAGGWATLGLVILRSPGPDD